MTIRASSARDVDLLLQQLRSPADLEREAAIARLRVIGARARERVVAVVEDAAAERSLRVAALTVIDDLDSPRSRQAALTAAADPDPAVSVAAIQAIRPWLARERDTTALTTVATLVSDHDRPTAVRQAAFEALSDLPKDLTAPLLDAVAPQIASTPPTHDASAAADWLANHENAPLGILHDLVELARTREQEVTDAAQRRAWFTVRVATHVALARRGSRLAIYDLRDLFDHARTPLPIELLAAMRDIGELSCLEPLARAWEAASGDDWWRTQVVTTATTILQREKATNRNAIVKRTRAKWPGFLP